MFPDKKDGFCILRTLVLLAKVHKSVGNGRKLPPKSMGYIGVAPCTPKEMHISFLLPNKKNRG